MRAPLDSNWGARRVGVVCPSWVTNVLITFLRRVCLVSPLYKNPLPLTRLRTSPSLLPVGSSRRPTSLVEPVSESPPSPTPCRPHDLYRAGPSSGPQTPQCRCLLQPFWTRLRTSRSPVNALRSNQSPLLRSSSSVPRICVSHSPSHHEVKYVPFLK